MKRILSFAFAGALALAAMAAPAHAQLKMGYINSQRVLAETPAFAEVRATLEREFATQRAEIDSLEARLGRADAELRSQTTLTDAVRQQRQQALQQQFAQYQQRAQQIQQQVQTREQALVRPVMERIRGVLEEVRAAGGFSFIMDPPEGVIVAVDPALDVTDQVVRRLGGTPAAPGAAPAGPRRP
ncbi:MAG TPA: OmpH family outer membrane protein [Longimicrobium sp.]|jgi:outer membrane protein|uniref:OmpH family outer membrane protein n=1 Tax=Longimicrobium sp. TaxID=2029185 RepID=UPI002EDA4468